MKYHVLFWNLCIVYSVWIRLNIFVTSNICNFFFVAFIEMGGVSLCSPGWPRIHDSSGSASQNLEWQADAIMPSCHIFMRINVKTLFFSCLYNYIIHYYRIKYYVYLTTTKSITLKQSLVPHPGNLITDSYHKTLCLRCMFTFLCSAADEARDSRWLGMCSHQAPPPAPQ